MIHSRYTTKGNKIVVMLLLLLFISSCSKASDAKDSVDRQIDTLKETFTEVPAIQPSTVLSGDNNTQIVILPSDSPSTFPSSLNIDTLSSAYRSPCFFENYKILNSYCSFKNFWHNQSTLLSWYVGYPIILFLFFIAVIYIWWNRKKVQ